MRRPPPGKLEEPTANRLYLQAADGRFEDATVGSGLGDLGVGQGVAVGDVDGDGDLDIFVANIGRDRLFLNQGDGRFVDATEQSGLGDDRWSVVGSFCDYDRDGDLDLYVVHYVAFDPNKVCRDKAQRREFCGPQVFSGEPDSLYRNRGDGTFEDVTDAAGIVLPERGQRARGLGVVCLDLTGDDWVDFYVANDGESNQLWVNGRDGTFSEQGIMRGVAVNRNGRPEASMGIAAGDINGDGWPDLFITHLFGEHNTLYLGSEGALFSEGTLESGLARDDVDLTGFGCSLIDYDHDGDLDLVVANGAVRRRRAPFPDAGGGAFWSDYAEPNVLFDNDGGGEFRRRRSASDDFSKLIEVSRGLATGDIDADGDIDLVLTNAHNGLRVYFNDAPPSDHHWLIVRARTGARDAIAAKLVLSAGDLTTTRYVLPGSSYVSSSDPRVHFGLGPRDRYDSIEVVWPDGAHESFPGGTADRVITIQQGDSLGSRGG